MVNLLLKFDCKESVSRGQNTALYNRIFIYNLCGTENLHQQIENNILTLKEDSSQTASQISECFPRSKKHSLQVLKFLGSSLGHLLQFTTVHNYLKGKRSYLS